MVAGVVLDFNASPELTPGDLCFYLLIYRSFSIVFWNFLFSSILVATFEEMSEMLFC